MMSSRRFRCRVGVLGAIVVAALIGCSKGGPASDGQDASSASVGEPAQFPPSQPGYLDVNPPAVALTVGQRATLSLRLFDSAGATQPTPPTQWSSSSQDVATVDSTGNVTAVALGAAEITATDGSHGTYIAHIEVVDVAPTGAFAAVFTPPIVFLGQGQTATPSVTFTDAAGHMIPSPSGLTLTTGNPSSIQVQATSVSAQAPGLAIVGAAIPAGGGASVQLAGSLLVAVSPKAGMRRLHPLNLNACVGNVNYTVEGCATDFPPVRYWSPGQSDTMRVYTWSQGHDSTGDCGPPLIQEGPPSQVSIAPTGVVGLGPKGTLDSLAPGAAVVTEQVGNLQCSSFLVGVFPDMSGSWTLTCSNGDQGAASGVAWRPAEIDHYAANHAASAGDWSHGTDAMGVATCATYGRPQKQCDAYAGSGLVYLFPGNASAAGGSLQGQGACSPSNPCSGIELGDCSNGDHPPITEIVGPDTLVSADGKSCTLKRGGNAACPDAGPQDAGVFCSFNQNDAGACLGGQNDDQPGVCAPSGFDGGQWPGLWCCLTPGTPVAIQGDAVYCCSYTAICRDAGDCICM